MNEQLLQKIRLCTSLPSLPAIAVQVLDLAQRPDADIAEIARIISKDAALSGKILRTVNSSFYGRSQAVSTISNALVILGLQSVKTLVLGFSLVSTLSKTKSKGFKHLTYWKRSIYAATAARLLASKVNLVQQEEAFLAALMKDIGMLVLDQCLGEQYGDICAQAKSHGDLVALEQAALETTHAEVSGLMAEQWKLPPLLSTPITMHHSFEKVEDPALRKLTEIVGLAGRCADVFVDDQPAGAIARVRQAMEAWNGSTEADADVLLAEIGKRTKEVAPLFEINLAGAQDYDAVLKKANEALVEITLQSQMQATQLVQQNQQLKKQADQDGLTGLANRRSYDEWTAAAFAAAVAAAKPISLLMIDVDKFKTINDTYGHPCGDEVLRCLGKLLQSAARPTDLAARYGGEELVLVLPNSPKPVASMVAESVRRAVAAKPVKTPTALIKVTASIGVSTWEPGCPFKSFAQIMKAADLALYNAKNSGRNCVKVFTLKSAA